MNRPNIEDYEDNCPKLVAYCKSLENYCDFLEKENISKFYMYRKVSNALDKASVKLSELERQYNFLCGNMNHRNKLYWKEWCLNDE